MKFKLIRVFHIKEKIISEDRSANQIAGNISLQSMHLMRLIAFKKIVSKHHMNASDSYSLKNLDLS